MCKQGFFADADLREGVMITYSTHLIFSHYVLADYQPPFVHDTITPHTIEPPTCLYCHAVSQGLFEPSLCWFHIRIHT